MIFKLLQTQLQINPYQAYQITVNQVLINLLIPKMNFATLSPGDNNFNKLMMQKHLDRKRQHRQNYSINHQSPNEIASRLSAIESLPLVGQTSLYQSGLANSTVIARKRRQVNEQDQKMKKLVKDQLHESLLEQENKKLATMRQEQRIKKVMSTENGMLDYLEKQIEKRDNFIKRCLEKQEINKGSFIDEDMRKHRNALHLIEQNYDVDVFNHESDRYQQIQKINFKKVLQTNSSQAQNQKMNKQLQRSQYGRYLDEKYIKQRHNPITNPLEYHIENPYIRKQLQRY